MSFYDEMADMVSELLAPESREGLGQGTIILKRRITVVDQEEPWNPPVSVDAQEQLRAVAFAIESKDGSSSYPDGQTVLAGDLVITSAVPQVIPWTLGGGDEATLFVQIDGSSDLPVIHVTTIPEAGTPVAVKFYARGPKA